jgi:hypothetical protein
MTPLLGAASVLLLAAGAAKVADPSATAGALGALGWPSSPALVRAGAGGEAVLGAAGLAVGGPLVAALVAASYLGFALFVASALRAGEPLATCGCFGRADTPPRPAHVVVDIALAAGAATAAVAGASPLVEASAGAWVATGALAVLAYLPFWQR